MNCRCSVHPKTAVEGVKEEDHNSDDIFLNINNLDLDFFKKCDHDTY